MQVGVNAYSFSARIELIQVVSIEKVGGTHKFACEQLQHTIAGRYELLKETSLKTLQYNLDPKESWNQVTESFFKT